MHTSIELQHTISISPSFCCFNDIMMSMFYTYMLIIPRKTRIILYIT